MKKNRPPIKNTLHNRNLRFAQEHFLRPHMPQIHAETLGNFGYHRCRLLPIRITYAIICMRFLWDFYFSNFDLTYFNKYHMDFNPIKYIAKYEELTTIIWNGSL